MIKLTDIVYYGNGFVATFDDDSVANARFKVVNGKLIAMGLNKLQKAAIDVFNNTSINIADPRFQGITETAGTSGISPWTLILSGLVTTGQASTKVGDLVAGKEYILALLNSALSTTFAAGDPATLTFLGTQGTTPFMDQTGLSTPAAGIAGGRVMYVQALFASATTAAAASATDGDPTGDTTQIAARQNGEVYTSHTNNGNNTNGIYLVYERE